VWCGFIFVNTQKNPKPRKKGVPERKRQEGEALKDKLNENSVLKPMEERNREQKTEK